MYWAQIKCFAKTIALQGLDGRRVVVFGKEKKCIILIIIVKKLLKKKCRLI